MSKGLSPDFLLPNGKGSINDDSLSSPLLEASYSSLSSVVSTTSGHTPIGFSYISTVSIAGSWSVGGENALAMHKHNN